MTKQKIILVGGGGHCHSCIDVIETTKTYSIVGIIDLKENIGNTILGYPIIGCDDDLPNLIKDCDYFLITIGQIGLPKRRKELYNELDRMGAKLATIISPFAYVSKHASIGKGTIIMHQALINANTQVGHNSIINTKALIEHDAIVGHHCHVSTNAIINGGVTIGDDSFVGSSAVSKEYISIASQSFIKANSIIK